MGQRLLSLIGSSPVALIAVLLLAAGWLVADNGNERTPRRAPAMPVAAKDEKEAHEKNRGCLSCHNGAESMHNNPQTDEQRGITCVYCHGGNGEVVNPADARPGSREYIAAKNKAHVQPRFPELWGKHKEPQSSGNPQRTFALLNQEKWEFIRFINPGDLRVAPVTCGGCHDSQDKALPERIVTCVRKSMMAHGAMLWAAALYNNGSFPLKNPRFGESYSWDGVAQRIQNVPPPTLEQTRMQGVLSFLDPLPRWEITQMGNILRVFERGGGKRIEVGNPNPLEEPGKPDVKLSNRGLGTLLRTDPVFLGLQKTRLLDPMLSFLGTNDHPGDYRSSGCTTCHVVYANDRDESHSGPYAPFGNSGFSHSADPTIPKDEAGHPIKHQMTESIPSSQCVSCHHHPGTTVTNSYLGYTWWDNETHGDLMYPKKQKYPSLAEEAESLRSNPEGAAARGLWSDPKFLENVRDLNPKMNRTQFADFNGHGWIFRAVFKQDRKGNVLDGQGNVVPQVTPQMLQEAVKAKENHPAGQPIHLKDIHLERGMHCVDCHFSQDNHGNGNLYGETRNAVEMDCRDCHGTVTKRITRTTFKTSGNAAPEGGTNLASLRTPFDERRFDVRGGLVVQRSMVYKDKQWTIPQVADTIDPAKSPEAAYAHTLLKDGRTWGKKPSDEKELAHGDDRMTCYACHSSWVTSCFGCHLKMQANKKMPQLHNESGPSRNWTSYNFQTLRDDIFMLGLDGTPTGNRVAPVRSACAIYVSSQNQNREWIYFLQQTVSAEGFSGHAFSPHVPHTVGGTSRSGRKRETKGCADCHVSERNDNNAWMASVLMQGTNLMNFMGRYVYVGEGHHGFEAVVVTEREEPQAVIGSRLHEVAYPDGFRKHQQGGMKLSHLDGAFHHHGNALQVQLRGEYLYSAEGEKGLWVYDVANVDNKGFSERTVTAPVSPWGQRFYVKTKHATAVAAPATVALDPVRHRLYVDAQGNLRARPPGAQVEGERPINEEGRIHALYAYLYVADKYEGLILVNAATLLDGNPMNNFLKRALTFNPDGILNGAVNVTVAGNHAYVCCDKGVVVINLDDPLKPKVVAEVAMNKPRAVAIQFRYAFVCDADGVKVVDVTFPERPKRVAWVAAPDARNVYLARTYAYVAAGKYGLLILDIERPEQPEVVQNYNADGAMNDVHDVKVAIANASVFAYVADGRNGLRVLQLTSPQDNPGYLGFSPRPTPRLIATYHTHGAALSVSEGVDRDRGVDEGGNQVGVFGRRGARPFNLEEQRRMYVRDGRLFTVTDEPPTPPLNAAAPVEGSVAQQVVPKILLLLLLVILLAPLTFKRREVKFRGVANSENSS
jgi:hypothetical protein